MSNELAQVSFAHHHRYRPSQGRASSFGFTRISLPMLGFKFEVYPHRRTGLPAL